MVTMVTRYWDVDKDEYSTLLKINFSSVFSILDQQFLKYLLF